MNTDTLPSRVLAQSERYLSLLLSLAFVFSYYTRIGTAVILLLCAWYLFWNGAVVLKNRWALLLIGFFAAITLKDCLMWLIGQGMFKSFAKSGSRVFILAGCAAMIASIERRKLENSLLIALGVTALCLGISFFLMRNGRIPRIFNPNAFGMLAGWFPLAFAARLRAEGGRKNCLFALGILIAGFSLLFTDAFLSYASLPGSRTAPFAFVLGAIFVGFPRRWNPKIVAILIVFVSVVSVMVLSVSMNQRINKVLAFRPELWSAYAAKGAERPMTGWGYTESEDNKRLLGDLLEGKSIFQEFHDVGLGPHNSFIAMFFENGILAALVFIVLIVLRMSKFSNPPGIFDVSLMAYMGFMSADAMNPGGLTFLGFYLGICLLAFDHAKSVTMRGKASL